MLNINRKYDRYPGLNAFADHQSDLFFGRDKEINQLLNLILAENVVLLFAQSGVGKSSLLNAGILPRLRSRSFLPIKIRFHGWDKKDQTPVENLKATLQPYFSKESLPHIKDQSRLPFWEFIKGCQFTGNYVPVLVFDQFEEFFYFSPEYRAKFIEEIAEVLHPSVPNRILMDTTAAKELPAGWHVQPGLKVVFSIRSDRLFELNDLSKGLPQILKNRYELKPLTRLGATSCIVEPAAIEGRHFLKQPFSFSKDALQQILDFLSRETGEVESTQLQIICEKIERSAPHIGEVETKKTIEPSDYGGKEGLSGFIDDYYQSRIFSIAGEDDRKFAIDLLENKMLFDNKKLVVIESQLNDYLGDRRYLLPQLLDNRLLREDFYKGNKVFEISHDTLVESIVKFRQLKVSRLMVEVAEANRKAQELADASATMEMYHDRFFGDDKDVDPEKSLLTAVAIFDKYDDNIVQQVHARLKLAKYYAYKGQVETANDFLDVALDRSLQANNKMLEAHTYEVIASIRDRNDNDNREAFNYYLKALILFRDFADHGNYARLSENIAILLEARFDEGGDVEVIEDCLEHNTHALDAYVSINDYISVKRISRSIARVERYILPFGYLVEIFTGDIHELKGVKTLNIGRTTEDMRNDVSLNNSYVSRRHLSVSPDLQIDELRSINGTTINARPLYYGYSGKLNDGDVVCLANCLPLLFCLDMTVLEVSKSAWAIFVDGANRKFTYLTENSYNLVLELLSGGFQATVSAADSEEGLVTIMKGTEPPVIIFLGSGPASTPTEGDETLHWYLQATLKTYEEPGTGYKGVWLPKDEHIPVISLNGSMQLFYMDGIGHSGEGPYFQIILKDVQS